MDIADVAVSDLSSYDSLIVGAPTWHTGADEGRSGTAWDEAYGDIRSLDLSGKKVAVQGVGHVGEYLVDALAKEGAEVFISDIHEPTLKRVADTYDAKVVGLDAYGLRISGTRPLTHEELDDNS